MREAGHGLSRDARTSCLGIALRSREKLGSEILDHPLHPVVGEAVDHLLFIAVALDQSRQTEHLEVLGDVGNLGFSNDFSDVIDAKITLREGANDPKSGFVCD